MRGTALEGVSRERIPRDYSAPEPHLLRAKRAIGTSWNESSYQVLRRMMEGKPVLIHGDGTSLWTMTWNEDFAVGFAGLIGNPQAIGEAFQITSDESLSWNQIYGAVARALGVKLKPYYVSSAFLAEVGPKEYDLEGNLLGDKALTVGFDEGVRRALDYVLSHKECQIEDPEFDQWCDRVIDALENAKRSLKV